MTTSKELYQLLKTTERILKHKREKEILKGERFNVFSILRMESKENETHSAFLCELLNPTGSHFKGNLFLKLFLETIGDESIDVNTARVMTEKHIGFKNDKEKTGGRIDIYIWDGRGNSICIENKIYASDQFAQIERYCNHNSNKNQVYYLNLQGEEPLPESKGKLKAEKDFFIISYKEHIIQWLKSCIKEAAETPLVRETIRQYVILIQKLTYTMDKTSDNELKDIILKNYEEASYIYNNFINARFRVAEQVRKELFIQLQARLSSNYQVIEGREASHKWSNFHIHPKRTEDAKLYFGIESFSGLGHFDGNLFIGVKNPGAKDKEYMSLTGHKASVSGWWINVFQFTDFEGCKVNMAKPKTIQKLHNDKLFRNGFVEHIITETIDYLTENTSSLVGYLEEQEAEVNLRNK